MSKELGELILPEDVRYTKSHEWGKKEGNHIKAGITDFAQSQLGDVVFVEFPEIGVKFKQGDAFGNVESVKAVSELFMPIGGEIVKINETLIDSPGFVNEQPYQDGWMIEIKPDDIQEFDGLLDKSAYLDMLKGLKK